ncbi:MAG: hypothetical protein LBL93_07750 [Ruminococcus sp.]|jgi:hypothetical membrane protein|nr:hypothetical protein [Ruminococcus sp.]
MNIEMLPYTFNAHVIFCLIGLATFAYQFCRYKYIYYILSTVALASSMLIYVNTSKVFFYSIGIFELVMIVCIWIFAIVEPRIRRNREDETEIKTEN